MTKAEQKVYDELYERLATKEGKKRYVSSGEAEVLHQTVVRCVLEVMDGFKVEVRLHQWVAEEGQWIYC